MHPDHDRLLIKAAVRIHDGYTLRRPAPTLPEPPGYLLAELNQLRHQQQLADRKRLHAASRAVGTRYADELESLARRCQDLATLSRQLSTPAAVPSLHMLYEELCGLRAEFDDVEINLRAETLAVRTGRIVLEEVDLGPFEIRFDWNALGSHQPYEVIALEPRPASNSSNLASCRKTVV
jgi:hypothetical protein